MIAVARRLLALASVLAGLLGAVSLGACSGTDGTTPDCTPNVDKNGIHAVKDGCEQFAVCEADPSHPATCCKDADDMAACLFGFGVGSAPTTGSTGSGGGGGGSGGGSSSSASSSTTGSTSSSSSSASASTGTGA